MKDPKRLITPTTPTPEVPRSGEPAQVPVRIRAPRRIRRDLWVGWKPNGIGEVKPNHYGEMIRTAWDNRDNARYAWRILRKGVCDGCALGVAGFQDWTISGVHLCTTRLNLLRLNTMGALDPDVLADVEPLRKLTGKELRDLGRLPYPMLRMRGDAGFRRISWDAALELAAERINVARPQPNRSDARSGVGSDASSDLRPEQDSCRIAFYLTARGITNEVYYAAQKAARFLGTNNIDNAARVCHAPSTAVLKEAVGASATTVSYTDVIGSSLIVLFGANVANDQPVFMKYLYLARKKGAKVAVVNPFREPGLERYWVPSNVESAVFGTKIADEFFQVHTGGDIAFLHGVLKVLLEGGNDEAGAGLDVRFIEEHTIGFDELRTELDATPFDVLERLSGASRDDMTRFALMYAAAPTAVLVWSMGITQHAHGSDNVAAIVNLALARGNVGRPGAGLMPIRGHSGVQGGAEMGAYATALPGGGPITVESAGVLSQRYGFPVPVEPGLSAPEMLEAAHRGDLDVLWSSGGNFLEVLPDPDVVHEALQSVPLRVHQDIVLSSQMLVDPGEAVLLLPAATRYEQRDGGTETTTERRIIFSPEIPGPRIGEARSEWEIFRDLARRVDPERAHLVGMDSGQQIRAEIAEIVPFYDGIQHLHDTGDQVQWGGERLCDGWVFPTEDAKAHFKVVRPPEFTLPEGRFHLSTRRGKQFNTMVHKARDPLTGAERDSVLMSAEDMTAAGFIEGQSVLVRSDHGQLQARVMLAAIKPRNVQMCFPEANVLLPAGPRDERSHVPDYNTTVEILPGG